MRRWFIALCFGFGLFVGSPAAPARAAEGDAVLEALRDLEQFRDRDRLFIRYLFLRDGSEMESAVTTLNAALSKVAIPLKFPRITKQLVRVDFQQLSADEKKLAELLRVWEELRTDPYFREIVERDWVLVPSAPYFKEGQEFHEVWKLAAKKVRASLHAGGDEKGRGPQNLLSIATGSEAPIVDARFFVVRATSTVDLGFGSGLYYRFSGVVRSKDPKVTDLQLLLRLLGVDERRAEQVGSDNATVIFLSGVTGKPRSVHVLRGDRVPASRGQGLVWITQDPADDQVNVENDPIRNLLGSKFAASELIAELPNGYYLIALFNADGVLQDSAPDVVVRDSTVPPPYTNRLQGLISCLRCHGPRGGYQPLKNDLRELLSAGTDIYDDFAIKDSERVAVERIVQLYQWRPDLEVLPQSRLTLDRAIRESVGVAVEKACNSLAELFDDYAYRPVSPKLALLDLGIETKDAEEAKDTFKKLFPRLAPAAPPGTFIVRADPILAALRAGISISRPQWERIYPEVALRYLLGKGFAVGAPAFGSPYGTPLLPTPR